ncbi:MFS transporter [Boudabousia liubingyangii]|uniref:MFS transporter n=1 Tax=Boudabousia liubingyangii TaxID=1921764 RepID=A0A1Q5PQ47_9ACTO|nr:MFS transporter [Boudabousia liubingyangii]OKL48414.1 MFS transporter [Boudabousia liubingyangii]OKL49560.1 MFS transporter [Boudabousia liubingyangii]
MSTADPTIYVDEKRARFIKKWSSTLIAFGEFIDGYDLTVIGVAMVFLSKDFALSSSDKGLLVAVSFIGTAVGLIAFGDLADRIGRKKVFAFNLWVFIVTAIGAALITQVWMLWVMRFLIGVAIGMDLSCSSAFLAEVAPAARRGRLAGSLPNITFILGAIFSIVMAIVLQATVPEAYHSWIWRGMFLFAAVPSFLVLMGRKQLPESPRWLIQNGREEEAYQILKALDLDEEVLKAKPKKTNREYRKLFKGDARRRMLVCTAFFMLNTTAGPIVSFMGPVIFNEAGIAVKQNLYISLAANCIGLFALLIGVQLIDRVNRRTLGLVTAAVLTASALTVGLLGGTSNAFLFTGFICWTFATWLGPAVLAWIWSAEAYPTELRGFGAGLTQALARMCSAITAFIIPGLVHDHGYYAIAPYATVYFLMFLLVLFNPWLASTNESLEAVAEGELKR